MSADTEFQKLAREMRFAQRMAAQPHATVEDRTEAAKQEALFDAALARMVKRQEPSLFDGES